MPEDVDNKIPETDLFQQEYIRKSEVKRLEVSSMARAVAFERRKRLPYLLQKGLSKPGRISFNVLRRAVQAVAPARICVNVLKEKITKTPWAIQPIDPQQKVDPAKIKEVENFFRHPNKNNETLRSFLDKSLEDLFVLDSVAWEKTRYPDGKLAELHYVDAATVRPVFDDHGNQDVKLPLTNIEGDTKIVPVSYVQVLEDNQWAGREAGEVVAAWPKKDFIYFNMHPQGGMDSFGYGLSPIESVIGVVSNILSADNFNASYFEDGSFPPLILQVLERMDQREIEGFREYLYAELDGRFHRPAVFAGDAELKVHNLKDASQKDMQFMQYFELLCRLLAAAYGLSGQDIGLVDDLNRATSEVQKNLSEAKGYGSALSLIQEVFNQEIIWKDFGYDYIEFKWVSPDSLEPDKAATIYDTALKNGTLTINEVRKKTGEQPFDAWADTPAILTAEGYKPIVAPQEKKEEESSVDNVGGEKPYKEQAKDEIEKAINTSDNYRVFFDDRGYSQPFIFYDILTGKGKVVKPPIAVNLQSQDMEIRLSHDLKDLGCNVPEITKMTEVDVYRKLLPSTEVIKAFRDYQNMTAEFDSEKWKAKNGSSRKYPFYLVSDFIEGRNLKDALLLEDMKRDPNSYKQAILDLAKLYRIEKKLVLGDRRADQYLITRDKRAWGIDYQFEGNKNRYEETKNVLPNTLKSMPFLHDLFLKETQEVIVKAVFDGVKRIVTMFSNRN